MRLLGQLRFCACWRKRRRIVPRIAIKQSKSFGTTLPKRAYRRRGRFQMVPAIANVQQMRRKPSEVFPSSPKKSLLRQRRPGRTSKCLRRANEVSSILSKRPRIVVPISLEAASAVCARDRSVRIQKPKQERRPEKIRPAG